MQIWLAFAFRLCAAAAVAASSITSLDFTSLRSDPIRSDPGEILFQGRTIKNQSRFERTSRRLCSKAFPQRPGHAAALQQVARSRTLIIIISRPLRRRRRRRRREVGGRRELTVRAHLEQ